METTSQPQRERTHQSAADQDRQAGRAARKALPRKAHAEYVPSPKRDPLAIIEEQNADRLPELVPLRMARMAASPFAFFRGTAALQAGDLANGPDTGHLVVACGDAHLNNFGIYAAADRSLVFDLNDFDEATLAPWEWDVKRLITSIIIAAEDNDFSQQTARTAALAAARAYRKAIRTMAAISPLERYYLRSPAIVSPGMQVSAAKALRRTLKAAAKRTSARTAAKIMERADDGSALIREAPPTLTHLDADAHTRADNLVAAYRNTAAPDIAWLLNQYTFTDVARRVVGVGSVGTRCTIAVFTGPHGEPLILQMKEAGRSVLDRYGRLADRRAQDAGLPGVRLDVPDDGGARVTAFQRVLQAGSDAFLGHLYFEGRGYYVRQFRDQNASIEIADLDGPAFLDYGRACAHQLARAHAQSPRAEFIAAYLGTSGAFDTAVTDWSHAYADQSKADHAAFTNAITAGRFPTTDLA